MAKKQSDWTVSIILGKDTRLSGQIEGFGGGKLIGDGTRHIGKPDYDERYEWLSGLRDAVIGNSGSVVEKEIELSRRRPSNENDRSDGVLGGTEIEIADIFWASWSALGGIKGIIAFLKMIKEFKGLWESNRSIEVTMRDGTKFKVSNVKDIELAIKAIKKLEG